MKSLITDRQQKFLIVDDQADQLSFLSSVLEKEFPRAEILVALDGKGGLAIAKDNQPDLIITDWKMPSMDGTSMIKHLKEISETSTIPVILLTGMSTTSEDFRQVVALGAMDFVKKPYDPVEIVARVKAILRFSYQNKELLRQQEINAQDKLALAQEKAQIEKEKMIAEEKIRKDFFSKMTHEFKTPLTLILGPLENVLSISKNKAVHEQASMAFRNGKIMLRLVNQLLDFERLKVGHVKLNVRAFDFNALVEHKIKAFKTLSDDKGLELMFKKNMDSLKLEADPDLVDQVLNNVITNAIKFTPSGGQIVLTVEGHPNLEDHLLLTVKDSGIGINRSSLPFVFDLYYRVDNKHEKNINGVGLGLPLTKELIELHQGEIEINSVEGLGTSVSITLPLKQTSLEAPVPDHDTFVDDSTQLDIVIDKQTGEEVDEDEVRQHSKSLLVVDDNADIRKYIVDALRDDYNIIQAADGKDAWGKVQHFMPDLVISDVLMPFVNGFELCEYIKNSEITSHIPVILLTGSTNEKEKLTGFEMGAEAFIPKPFNVQALALQIGNLFESREQLFSRYKKDVITHPDDVQIHSREEKFLLKLKEYVSEHLSDEQLSVETLAEKMAMSRTQLYRKLKSITNQNVSEFIRNYRLEHAKKLLEQDTDSIAEIAFQSGFSSTSYFSKSFSAKYGVSPKKIQKEGHHKKA